jgi:hypothetical protein
MPRVTATERAIEAIEESLSPAEACCTQRERAFVYWLIGLPPRRGYKVRAARLAGYGKNSTPQVVTSIVQVLLKQQRVIDLISEVTKKQIRAMAPEALQAVKEIIADSAHSDRLKAAQVVLERIEPTMQRVDVNVRHEVVDRDGEAVAYLRKLKALGVSREKLEEELGFSDLPRYERLLQLEDAKRAVAPVIDAEYSIVEEKQ